MTQTLAPTAATVPVEQTTQPAHRLWRNGLAAGAVAAGATTAIAAVADAADVSFADRNGDAIPLAGFAQMALLGAILGIAIAAVLARKARHPRATFVRTTVSLTALSVIPDFTFGFAGSTIAALIATHLVAAAIVIPTIARRLATHR